MSDANASEVLKCPNCSEEVPKTLYCLNCGYPLYKDQTNEEADTESKIVDNNKSIEPKIEGETIRKEEPSIKDKSNIVREIEQKPTELVIENKEVSPKPDSEKSVDDDDAVLLIDEEEKPEVVKKEPEMVVEELKPQETIAQSQQEIKLETVVEVPVIIADITQVDANASDTPKMDEKPADVEQTVTGLESDKVEATKTEVEAVVSQVATEEKAESLSSSIDATRVEASIMIDEFEEEVTTPVKYIPDELTRDLMENIIKNIMVTTKLIKLFREGNMREETFSRLLDGYLVEGTRLFQRRADEVRKLGSEIDSMEDDYNSAIQSLELLEIRHSIGDAVEDEYNAKVPGFRWDIDNYDTSMNEKKNKLSYVENISSLIAPEELKSLKEMTSLQYNTLDALHIVNEESLTKIKDFLYQAIKELG